MTTLTDIRTSTVNGQTHAHASVHGTKARQLANRFGVSMGRGRWWFVGQNWSAFQDAVKQ